MGIWCSHVKFLRGFCGDTFLPSVQVLVETGEQALLPNFGFIRGRCPALMDVYLSMMSKSAAMHKDDAAIKPVMDELAEHYPLVRSPHTPFQSKCIRAFDHFKCHNSHSLPTLGTEEHAALLKITGEFTFLPLL